MIRLYAILPSINGKNENIYLKREKFARMGALFQLAVHFDGFNLWASSQVLGIGYWLPQFVKCNLNIDK
jgi:hypothetical protein